MKNLVNFIVFIFFAVLLYRGVAYCVVNENSLNRLKYHDFYNAKDLKIVAVGASGTLEDFDSKVANEILNTATFNMGTASQQMEGTYYQTKEILQNQDVDTIILEIGFPILCRDVGAIKPIQIMTDYMQGHNKTEFIMDAIDSSQWLMMFSRVYREHDADTQAIINNLKAKASMEYRTYANYNPIYTNYNNYEQYGYYKAEKLNDGYDFFMFSEDYGEFDSVNEPIVPEQIEYLKKTIFLCKDAGVKIILVTYPRTLFYLQKCGDYDKMHQYIQSLADEYEVSYYDLNLIKEIDWTDQYLANLDHCSAEGAQLTTRYICRLLQGEDISFCQSIHEKYTRDIVGILYNEVQNEDGSTTLSWTAMSDTNRPLSYRILGKDVKANILFDSGMLQDAAVILPQRYPSVELELYDAQTKAYLGNEKKL